MNIKIHAINFDITPAIDEYVSKKMLSLEKFLDKNEESVCEVEIGRITTHHKSGDVFKAEVNITQGGKQYFAEREKADIYTAIDLVRDEMERMIVSAKTKKDSLIRRGGARIKSLIKRIRN